MITKSITVRNCDEVFKFKCPLNWSDLRETEEENKRFCNQCENDVFLCKTDGETIDHAKQGHCIARVNFNIKKKITIGQTKLDPSEIIAENRNRREEAITVALKVNSGKTCKRCSYPVNEDSLDCEVCKVK